MQPTIRRSSERCLSIVVHATLLKSSSDGNARIGFWMYFRSHRIANKSRTHIDQPLETGLYNSVREKESTFRCIRIACQHCQRSCFCERHSSISPSMTMPMDTAPFECVRYATALSAGALRTQQSPRNKWHQLDHCISDSFVVEYSFCPRPSNVPKTLAVVAAAAAATLGIDYYWYLHAKSNHSSAAANEKRKTKWTERQIHNRSIRERTGISSKNCHSIGTQRLVRIFYFFIALFCVSFKNISKPLALRQHIRCSSSTPQSIKIIDIRTYFHEFYWFFLSSPPVIYIYLFYSNFSSNNLYSIDESTPAITYT